MAVKTRIDGFGVRETSIPDGEPIGFGVYANTKIFGDLEVVSGTLNLSGSVIQKQQYTAVGAGTYNVSESDESQMLEVDPSGGTTTLVVPSSLDAGFFFYFRQIGTGTVTVSGSAGVTVSSTVGSEPSLSAQWGHATADKRSSTQWVVAGDIV